MRRLAALSLVAPLLAAPLALGGSTGPAAAGAPHRTVFHGLPADDWSIRSFDCSGAEAAAPTLALEDTSVRTTGAGSLAVEAGPDAIGGVLLRSSINLERLVYPVHADADADADAAPRAVWRAEVGDHVLTSDPVDLAVGAWTDLRLADATLHEGAWSGTIHDWIDRFGPAGSWTAGVLTGGCLDSDRVHVDDVHGNHYFYDLEPSDWLSVRTGSRHPLPWITETLHAQRFRIPVRAFHADLLSGDPQEVADARIVLERRPRGAQRWGEVARTRTDVDGRAAFTRTAQRSATYRAVWRRHGAKVARAETAAPARLRIGLPRVDGRVCPYAYTDVVSWYPPGDTDFTLCDPVTARGRTLRVTGTLRPSGGTVWVRLGERDGRDRMHWTRPRLRPGADHRWSTRFRVRPGHSYVLDVADRGTRRLDSGVRFEGVVQVR